MSSRTKFEAEYGPRPSNSNTFAISNSNGLTKAKSQKKLMDGAMASYFLEKKRSRVLNSADVSNNEIVQSDKWSKYNFIINNTNHYLRRTL